MKIVAATSNAHKLKEIRAILKDYEILSEKEAGFFGDVEETGATFEENARLKAQAVCRATGFCTIADDSGLCVEALKGAPGIYSARYSGGGDKENRALLLKNLGNNEDRTAYFACAVVLTTPDGKEYSAIGKSYGKILYCERGENGFGYDPLFLSDDLGKTFAEASEEEKNSVSHRGRALKELLKVLEQS